MKRNILLAQNSSENRLGSMRTTGSEEEAVVMLFHQSSCPVAGFLRAAFLNRAVGSQVANQMQPLSPKVPGGPTSERPSQGGWSSDQTALRLSQEISEVQIAWWWLQGKRKIAGHCLERERNSRVVFWGLATLGHWACPSSPLP